MKLLTIEHMAMFVVKSIYIQINGSINTAMCFSCRFTFYHVLASGLFVIDLLTSIKHVITFKNPLFSFKHIHSYIVCFKEAA